MGEIRNEVVCGTGRGAGKVWEAEKGVGELVEGYLEYCEVVRGMSPVTVGFKRGVLWRFVRVTGVRSVCGLDDAAMRRWGIWLGERGVSARSINVYNSVVVAFLRYLLGMGMTVPMTLALIVRLKETAVRRKFYRREEVMRVVSTAVASGDEQTGLMIMVMFETGMRIAEVCRMRAIDVYGRRVEFVGKGGKMREVYMTEATAAWLRRFVQRWGVGGGEGAGGLGDAELGDAKLGGAELGGAKLGGAEYVWHAVDGGVVAAGEAPLSTQTVRGYLKRAFAAAGFEGFYPHALRHSFATDLQARGASVAEIKEMMGHSSIATTERYLHGFEGRMRELFDKYR